MAECLIPENVDAVAFCRGAESLNGKVQIKFLQRLKHSDIELANDSVTVRLNFGFDELGQAIVFGDIEFVLKLTCQRCLQPMIQPMNQEIAWGLVKSEQSAKNLDSRYEPVFFTDQDGFKLYENIEDEIILSVPVMPTHSETFCNDSSSLSSKAKTSPPTSPFANLADLLKNSKK